MIRAISIALLLSCGSLSALADQMTVADLQQMCDGSNESTQNACRFYILGVVDEADLATGLKTVGGPFCVASDVPTTSLVAAVKRMMQADLIAYPQDKSLPAAGFVAAAAMKAFPCKK